MRKYFAFVAIIIAAIACAWFFYVPRVSGTTIVSIGTESVMADIVADVVSHERGLSGRKTLDAGRGMLFVFDRPGVQMFWMKDMNFPIDIVWIDGNKMIVGVTERVEPATYPTTYSSVVPVQYVLEISSGEFAASGAHVGSMVTF